jgi:LPS-assembly lipoprotein
MSWPSLSQRALARLSSLVLTLALGGCLQPMYGKYAAGGPGLDDRLKLIAIEPIPDRIGHYLGDDLIFALNGTGSHPTPKYRLFVELNESVQTPLIDTVSGRASAATVVINADYKLRRIDTDTQLTGGKAFVFKSYDRFSDRFANIRAARDAEIHDAQQLADELRIRIASYLAEHPES